MSALKRNLKIIYNETTAPLAGGVVAHPNRRYVARAFGSGTGWGVWDVRAQRYLRDEEVRVLTEEQIRSIWVN
jgi:hypothetical protein